MILYLPFAERVYTNRLLDKKPTEWYTVCIIA